MSGNLTIISDVFSEGVSGQFLNFALVDPSSNTAVNTAAITSATATMTSLDTGNVVFASANVMPGDGSRGSFQTGGVLRLTFTAADLAGIGSRELQTRMLVLDIVHSGNKSLKQATQFRLRNVAEL